MSSAEKAMRTYERAHSDLASIADCLRADRREVTMKAITVHVRDTRDNAPGVERVGRAIVAMICDDFDSYADRVLAAARDNVNAARIQLTLALDQDAKAPLMTGRASER